MYERYIKLVLETAIEQVNDDPRFLRQFFEKKGLDDAEIEAIETYWNEHPLKVIHQYPRGEPPVDPLWAIVLAQETEQEPRLLGDEGGIIGIDDDATIDDPSYGADMMSSFFLSKYSIYTYSTHADITLYYYELCKFFLIRNRAFFKSPEGGMALHTAFSGGDMGPDPRYSPTYLFIRKFDMDVLHEERVAKAIPDEGTGRAFRVRGIHVNNDVEDVVAKVDPYSEEVE